MAKKKKHDEVIEQDCRTKITVSRVYGEQSILDLYAEYVAEKVRAERRTAETAKKAS